jgi:hypothetical protein
MSVPALRITATRGARSAGGSGAIRALGALRRSLLVMLLHSRTPAATTARRTHALKRTTLHLIAHPYRSEGESSKSKEHKKKDGEAKPHKKDGGDKEKKHKDGDKKDRKADKPGSGGGAASGSKKDKAAAAGKPGAPPPPARRVPPAMVAKKGAAAADDYLAGMDLPSSESEGEEIEQVVREDKGPLNLQVRGG